MKMSWRSYVISGTSGVGALRAFADILGKGELNSAKEHVLSLRARKRELTGTGASTLKQDLR